MVTLVPLWPTTHHRRGAITTWGLMYHNTPPLGISFMQSIFTKLTRDNPVDNVCMSTMHKCVLFTKICASLLYMNNIHPWNICHLFRLFLTKPVEFLHSPYVIFDYIRPFHRSQHPCRKSDGTGAIRHDMEYGTILLGNTPFDKWCWKIGFFGKFLLFTKAKNDLRYVKIISENSLLLKSQKLSFCVIFKKVI
jgi:hypothetical protein